MSPCATCHGTGATSGLVPGILGGEVLHTDACPECGGVGRDSGYGCCDADVAGELCTCADIDATVARAIAESRAGWSLEDALRSADQGLSADDRDRAWDLLVAAWEKNGAKWNPQPGLTAHFLDYRGAL